ncbi:MULTISPECIES: restriction endonuclease subunit S [Mycolicibacterium]|uniref:restriction endonuclease subunit S n=1 Tax=Mycobacteriaceae TaxID=1762 RepID=UPI001950EA9D|nr:MULTISPECIES: restriction endonuclease subunit S [Mycolicibacterium]
MTPEAGDLLFSYETRIGEAALMPAEVRACLGRRMALLRPNRSQVNPRFLLYFYLSPDFQRTIAKHTIHGATVSRIGLASMPDWDIEIPSLGDQHSIAEVLGALDDKIAANERLMHVARDLANARFSHALNGGLEIRVADAAEMLSRGVSPKYVERGGVTVLNQKCVRNQRVSLSPARSMAPLSTRLDRLLRKNDVLVNSTGVGTLGRTARWTDSVEATVDSHITIVRFDDAVVDPVCAGFGLLRLESAIESLSEGSTGQTELRRDLLGNLRLLVPPRAAQRQTAEELDKLDALERSSAIESAKLARTRDELLPLLMSGKVRAKDAETVLSQVLP